MAFKNVENVCLYLLKKYNLKSTKKLKLTNKIVHIYK